MIITNHVITGALVGHLAPGPVSAFVAGVASHFAIDAIPHWGDEATFLKVAVVDGLVGLTAMGVIAVRTPKERRRRVVAGMLGACAPDADKPSELFFGRSPYPFAVDEWHRSIQQESPRKLPQEIAVATLGALLLRRTLR